MNTQTLRSADPDTQSEFLDVRALLAIVQRRFWIMALVGLSVFAAIIVYSFQITPRYTASAMVLIETREQQVIDFEAVMSGLAPDSAAIDTEVEVIRSRQLAQAVSSQIGLDAIPEFNPALREPSLVDRIRLALRRFLGGLRPVDPASGSGVADASEDAREELAQERIVDSLLDATTARRVGMTYVIEITAISASPQLAQEIANTYADQYLLAQLEAKFAATERANTWLNERVDALREEVRAAEQAVASFRAQEGLLDAEGATLTEQQISDINAQLANQRAELSEARARLRNVRSRLQQGVSPESITEVLRSEVVRELRNQQAQVTRRAGELATRYGPRHPEILTVQRELADIETQIDREIERIVASLENEVDVARERVGSLELSLAELRAELAADDASLVRLRELEREAEASRALFDTFLNRFRQTGETEELTAADARIIAEAALPTRPSEPNLTLNTALALAIGAFAAVGTALLLELFDIGIRTELDVETKLGASHISSVPKLKTPLPVRLAGGRRNPVDYVVDKPLSGLAESYRAIRSAISVAGIDKPIQVVAVTSALPGEGKTTTTVCLGRIAAQASDRVVVVDCDLRRRQLSKLLAAEAEHGLLDVLSRERSIDEVIVKDARTELDIVPLTSAPFTPRDVFRTTAFAEFVAELRRRYQLVILDTAPVMAVADTRTIASAADGVVYTTEWGRSAVGSSRLALGTLASSHGNLIGVVLNSVDVDRQGRYGYGAYYGYYAAYRKYYSE